MEFRTQVAIQEPPFRIEPCEEILFVGSCFADAIGQRFREEAFPVTVNPYGVMYNPASILHTVEKWKVEREKWKEKCAGPLGTYPSGLGGCNGLWRLSLLV